MPRTPSSAVANTRRILAVGLIWVGALIGALGVILAMLGTLDVDAHAELLGDVAVAGGLALVLGGRLTSKGLL